MEKKKSQSQDGGDVSEREVETRRNTPDSLRQLRELFDLYDVDASGYVNAKEIMVALRGNYTANQVYRCSLLAALFILHCMFRVAIYDLVRVTINTTKVERASSKLVQQALEGNILFMSTNTERFVFYRF